MKRNTLLFLFLTSLHLVPGQSLERKVFSTAGQDATIGFWHYDFTFGEPIIGTVLSTSPIMTMGFQQPLILTPLQVEWLGFSGSLKGEDGVLEWDLRDPSWPGIFTVERAAVGEDFVPIGRVDGLERGDAGYQFVDERVIHSLAGQARYRLQLSAPDGRISYSKVVELRWEEEKEIPQLHLFPNPAHDFLQVQWSGEAEGSLRLYDLAGRLLQQHKAAGQTFRLDVGMLPAGAYLIEAELRGQVFRRKFVKQ